ncbi:MAG TPA: hypothetical protein PKO15_05550 [Fibrobacteria bacterium]|nr:hypothetical protein [Fibrobacteria bacterium]HOX51936.1 hypothetical protein [Fibrobacteria bacterium]
MKRSLSQISLCLALLSGCDGLSPNENSDTPKTDSSATTSAGTKSSGSTSGDVSNVGDNPHDPGLIGTWRRAEIVGSSSDTVQVVLKSDGSTTNRDHYTEWMDGTVTYNSLCSGAGTWATSKGRIYTETSSTCSETQNGKTTTASYQDKDTIPYWISRDSLFLRTGEKSSGDPDTIVFVKD